LANKKIELDTTSNM